jgi:sigma-E factor negative regulatory protein RseB
VAGALTQVVALEPRDPYRYSRLLWIDTSTHLPLKLEVLNEDGMSVEQMVFTTIITKAPIAPQDLQPSVQASSAITQISHRETLPVDGLKWTFKSVPEGFQIVSYSILKRPPLNLPVEHVLMSDGFSSVSVYIEKRDGRIKPGVRKLGAASVDSVKLGDYEVTVMGEVPQKTVELIANGVRKKGDN